MSRISYVILGFCLFVCANLPRDWTDSWRSASAALLRPVWQAAGISSPRPTAVPREEKAEQIALREQVDALQEWLLEEKRLQLQAELLAGLLRKSDSEGIRSDLKRRAAHQTQMLALRYAGNLAQVIFRDPTVWGSTLWISLGEADNQSMGRCAIARNSPVLVGNSLVGVVEYVGRTQSRVRLITDAGLIVGVRAVRGGTQNRELTYHVQNLLEQIRVRADLFSSEEEQQQFVRTIQSFQERVVPSWEEELLAKGEISGCSRPLWRSRGCLLKGSGFNYHFSDEEGPARDLCTGRPIGASMAPGTPLLKVGDLLATSGLDGLFPPGIPVAIVKQIAPLKQGGHSYELEAKPAAGDLQDLHTVIVLPPIGFTEESL